MNGLVLGVLKKYSMKIAVVAVYDAKYLEMAQITLFDNFKKYCLIHGYDFHPVFIHKENGRHPAWRKITATINVLKTGKYDWVFYIDADCLFMNTTIKLESFVDDNYFLIISGINSAPEPKILNSAGYTAIMAAQFLIKNCQRSIDFLYDVWQAAETKDDFYKFDYEMRQMRISADRPQFKDGINVIKSYRFNRFWYSNDPFFLIGNPGYNENCWQYGDFIVHVVMGIKEARLKNLRDLSQFSGGAFVGHTFQDDRITFTSLYTLDDVTAVIKTVEGATLCTYNLSHIEFNYMYTLFFSSEFKELKVEGYDEQGKLIATHILMK